MKVTIVGAGNIGATTAHILAMKDLADIVLVDIKEGIAKGKALDILQSGPVEGFYKKIIGSETYEQTANSDISIITAGLARTPGMSRDDLLATNSRIVSSVAKEIAKYSPNSTIIVVSNPLDVMVSVAHKASGFAKNKVMGMAGILDSSRFRTFISQELNVAPHKVEAMVLGGHGDSMVPLVSSVKVDGQKLPELMASDKISQIVKRTRFGGIEIVNHLKQGSAYYAPASSIVEMVSCILNDEKKTLPVAALLEGEYGINGLFMGVPAILGKNGVESVVELELKPDEKEMFEKTATHVKELNEKILEN